MKYLKSLFIVAACALSVIACTLKAADTVDKNKSNEKMKAVIVYFTHTGNTELAAQKLASVTGARLVSIQPEHPYSEADVNWVDEQSRCTREHLDQSLRPAIKPLDINFAEVDTVFIGFPIWWHEEPAVIRTFLDNYRDDLQGKALYPFCTSYESPMSEADATLTRGYPAYNWHTGLRLPASTDEIKAWLAR